MDWWGPMLGVAEFAGERLCGFLQKINTNGKVEQMAQTIMRRFCHLQRLMGKAPPEMSTIEKKSQRNVGAAFEVDPTTYECLLKYYQSQDNQWTDFRRLPYPENAQVLGPFVREVMTLEGRYGMRYSKKSPNNIVKLEAGGKITWGKVLHIIQLDDPADVVVMVQDLSEVVNETLRVVFRKLGITRVVEDSNIKFISARSVVASVPHRPLPAWAMGLQSPSLLLVGVESAVQEEGNSRAVNMDVVYVANTPGDDAMEID
ncbi:uncharacterized protein MELLADRAFT_86041 [Melampsora larici-populina 98AG31]|uniref:Uncharacterized protein n=1 Tax=Melampsora larici-populina (strain 98AG31 / pathotype 3-4-7) TaxID=747676 RepID=F4RKJ5_MELLP|nr:uncharacterized protein MELLADRAFT_86041 [Melampsora larici-populina 98AG31]EGG07105.1 hypothetical protein MELLADRAFT_86041 [Melampsora larici-populina 98AG31]